MTTKPRDKWLLALILAIMVHIIVFALIYLNYHHNDAPTDKAKSALTTPAKSTTASTASSLPPSRVSLRNQATNSGGTNSPLPAKYDSGLESTPQQPTTPQPSLPSPQAPKHATMTQSAEGTSKNNTIQTSATHNASANGPDSPRANKRATKKSDNAISPSPHSPSAKSSTNASLAETPNPASSTDHTPRQPDAPLASDNAPSTPNNPLTAPAPNPVLLEGDLPSQGVHDDINQRYQKAKSETEDLNSRLSSAISEVKKRNQQKIEMERQRQSYAHAIDNIVATPKASSSPSNAADLDHSDPSTASAQNNALTAP